ncbi:hypothetical protein [Clostridium beijerinckii]|uniref:hypothetical protein n=1 Tax=Clostridium beijerinckii TaxID=1520 RepID=UPI00242B321C|nr:hypothetical protein [Clostridium beijerinckii]MDG5852446.1 hypothetical protein [Clostridium beijerinckii]
MSLEITITGSKNILNVLSFTISILNKIAFSVKYGRRNIYFIVLTILSIISVIYILLKGPVILLDDNQILYIYSTSAQITAGLYGLTLTGFIFFESKLKDIVSENETYYDHIESLKKIYYRDISSIGLITILVILMCILSISLYKINFFQQLLINLILTLTIVFVIIAIISIVYFSIKLLDPNKLSQIGKRIMMSIEESRSDKFVEKENIEANNTQLLEFVKNYKELELIILRLAKEFNNLEYRNDTRGHKTKPIILEALKILNYNQIINAVDMEKIDMLRKYRNVIVNGKDFNIDANILRLLKTYNEAMKNIFEARERKDNNAENNAYRNLREKVNELL